MHQKRQVIARSETVTSSLLWLRLHLREDQAISWYASCVLIFRYVAPGRIFANRQFRLQYPDRTNVC